MTWQEYDCGTCGSRVIVIRGRADGAWDILCENGHPWVSNPATEMTITNYDYSDTP